MNTRSSWRDRWSVRGFAIYLIVSWLFFGRRLIGHFTQSYIAQSKPDAGQCIWSLAWLPHALASGQNPVFTKAVWAPHGINLAWTMWVPLEALITWPLTAMFGPVASYNVLVLISLPLAAWSAFVLCRYVSGSCWASLAAGYLFGFSGYMLFYMWSGDLNLIAVFPIPLAIYTVLRAFNGEISLWALVSRLTALLVVLFGLFIELFATATMFGVMAFVLALVFFKGKARRRLRALLMPLLASYVVAVAILSPYLYFLLCYSRPRGPIWSPLLTGADLLFSVLPSHTSELAQIPALGRFLHRFPPNGHTEFNYLGPILLAIVTAYAWRHWRESAGALLLTSALLIALLSLGAYLVVGGHNVMRIPPGEVLAAMPVIDAAQPVRFTLYLTLVTALVTALWLANSPARVTTKCIVVGLALIFVMPSLSAAQWNSLDETPAFFTAGLYRKYLEPGEITLTVPYGWQGNSMLWQAHTGFYFRMAGGFTGIPPRQFQRWPVMVALFSGTYVPEPDLQLKAFLAAHKVDAVLVDSRAKHSNNFRQRQNYQTVIDALGPPPLEAGGLLIYRFAPGALAPWSKFAPPELECRADASRFAALLVAAQRYLQSGKAPRRLSFTRLVEMGLIRSDWVGGPDIRISNGLWVKPRPDGSIDLGTFGSRTALATLIERYRGDARRVKTIEIPSSGVGGSKKGRLELMVMSFDRRGLERAAERDPNYDSRSRGNTDAQADAIRRKALRAARIATGPTPPTVAFRAISPRCLATPSPARDTR